MNNNKKTAIIVGSSGQDGTILSSYLKKRNYEVTGLDKKNIDISNKKDVFNLIKQIKPNHVYFLAAHHKSSQDINTNNTKEIRLSLKTNVISLMNFLEAIRVESKKTKLFYAGSSLMFGNNKPIRKTESTPFSPNSIYGITKTAGSNLCKLYREKYNIFTSVGILFNHESEFRKENFIFMKVIKGALDIKYKGKKELIIGDLSAQVDWGYAYDYVEAMHNILKIKKPDDFIIATGKLHTVKDLIEIVFKYLKLDWKKYVREEKNLLEEKRIPAYGDYSKLKKETDWYPKNDFKTMILKIMKKINEQYQ